MATIQAGLNLPPDASAMGRPRSRRLRQFREGCILATLVFCGTATVLVTVSILFILIRETWTFFTVEMSDIQGTTTRVSLADFFGDLEWAPLAQGDAHFGIWPLIAGTGLVTVLAMLFALPLGLITAVWLSEYANKKIRAVIKPVLEVLAGIPTVVFGFFALTVITPFLRFEFWQQQQIDPITGQGMVDSAGNAIMGPANPLDFGIYNALAAGLAVGIMCLPIVTSLSEDALQAVPRSLREAAYGLGSSRFETSVRVVVPAGLSGIIAAFLLAVARAVGETMIVTLAAGSLALPLGDNLAAAIDPRSQLQTMTAYMVQIFLGDVEHGGVEYQSCYAVAMTLFLITLGLTIFGGIIRRRFRQVYD